MLPLPPNRNTKSNFGGPPRLAVFLFALMLQCVRPLMTHSGHSRATVWSPLSGVKRTRPLSDRARQLMTQSGHRAASDPKRASAGHTPRCP
jgi:hypothetical protein